MQCLISLPCCELLCQAVKKCCCNIQSQTRVHSRSRETLFLCISFYPDQLSLFWTWLSICERLWGYLAKKYTQISLYNLGCIPLVVHLRKLRHKEFYLTYAKVQTYQQKTPSRKKKTHFPCLNSVTPRLYHLPFFPDLSLSSPFSLTMRNIFPGSDSNLERSYMPPCKKISSWHGEARYSIKLA